MFIDKYNRLIDLGPKWKSKKDRRPLLADNIWRTALGCFAYPDDRPQLMEGLNSCLKNGNYWRHPDWSSDNFSRDQYIMLIAAQYFFGNPKKFPPKIKLSKRYFSGLGVWSWWKYLTSGKKIFDRLFVILTTLNLFVYRVRWYLHDLIKTPPPEFFGFHLMCWQYYCYNHKRGAVNEKLKDNMSEFLLDCEYRVSGNVWQINDLLDRLLGSPSYTDKSTIKRVSGFPWQNLVPWQNIKTKSHHKYSKGYWIEVPKGVRCLFVDIFNFFNE